MTHPDLDELVRLARSDRPAPSVLSALARSLRVPLSMAPIAALAAPATASAAAVAAKAGLSRVAFWGIGAGSVVAAGGVAAAVFLGQAAPPPSVPAPAPSPSAQVVPKLERVAPVAPAPAPVPEVAPSAEKRTPKDTPASWDEPALIERARRALAEDPRRALALAQEHQRRFPAGALKVEREVIALEALARSGQTQAALRRARQFEARYPNSIHLPRVRALRSRLGDAP